jgi:hypothetical protein
MHHRFFMWSIVNPHYLHLGVVDLHLVMLPIVFLCSLQAELNSADGEAPQTRVGSRSDLI